MRIKWFSLVRVFSLFLVLLYHFFQPIFRGGFIGVDILFTFSGFLITSLFIDEFSTHGCIDLLQFFKRRFYRIVPPLTFMLIIVLPFTLLIRKDFLADVGTQIIASLGFVSNFYEILTDGNYENQFIPHLFVHTWSLSLEVHYYLIWGFLIWVLSKRIVSIGRFRGTIFLISLGLFLFHLISMLIGSCLNSNFSPLYFSSFTHSFPFFIGSALATVLGIKVVGVFFYKIVKSWSVGKTIGILFGDLILFLFFSLFLKFDSIWTYFIGLPVVSIASVVMIISTRILHEKTEHIKEPVVLKFLADISYGVYLFHWPFYIIFSQIMRTYSAVFLTLFFSVLFATFSFYVLEPLLSGRKLCIFGVYLDKLAFRKIVFYIISPLLVVSVFLIFTAPRVSDFEQSLTVDALNQAEKNMDWTRNNVDSRMATEYNVVNGTTIIGDSVALRSSQWLQEIIPSVQIDATISRNLSSGSQVFQLDIINDVLLKNVVIALGTNTVDNYEEMLNYYVDHLPKGHRLVFITPYDGRVIHDVSSTLMRTRDYQLALSEKYDYVYLADWYQTAVDNPTIWYGTDHVHFGVDTDTIVQGGRLYSQTLASTLKKAEGGPVKP